MAAETRFVENLHYVPDADWMGRAFTVLRAGRVEAAPGYGVRRSSHVGQDVLFCLSGAGTVETDGERIGVEPGQVVWIANERPHAHVADPASPWTLLWFRFDGPDPAAMRTKIFGDFPSRTMVGDLATLTAWFGRLFSALRRRDIGLDLRLNQMLGDFFLMLSDARMGALFGSEPDSLAPVIAAVRADIGSAWPTGELAQLCRLSPSQTRRLFRKQLGESPRRWVTRERLIAAQSMMMRDATPLSRIADACGFCDVYHFGREFKRAVGTSPAQWRRVELGHRRAERGRAPSHA